MLLFNLWIISQGSFWVQVYLHSFWYGKYKLARYSNIASLPCEQKPELKEFPVHTSRMVLILQMTEIHWELTLRKVQLQGLSLFPSRNLQFCKYNVLFLFLYLIQLSALLPCHQTAVNCKFNQWIFSIPLWIIYPHNTLREERCTFPTPRRSLSK